MLRALIFPFVMMSDCSDWCEVHAGDGDLCVVDLHHPLRVGVGSHLGFWLRIADVKMINHIHEKNTPAKRHFIKLLRIVSRS